MSAELRGWIYTTSRDTTVSCGGVDLSTHSLAGDLISNGVPVLPRDLCTFRDQLIALFVITHNSAAVTRFGRTPGLPI